MRPTRFLLLRRALLALVAAAPLAALGQKPAVLAVLSTDANDEYAAGKLAYFRRGLREAGVVEGRDAVLEARFADGRYDRLPEMARAISALRPAIVFGASLPSALALRKADPLVPMVFVMGADPVRQGLVASLQHPGGKATGVTQLYGELGGKRLELLRELVPSAKLIAVLSNPRNTNSADHITEVRKAAGKIGLRAEVLNAANAKQLDEAFASASQLGAQAVLVADDPFFSFERNRIVALASAQRLPAIHYARDFVSLGGLASYGPDVRDNYRLAGDYAGKILRGADPANLPVLQPTRFELVLNRKAAAALGITISPSLRLRADEVIE